MKRRLFWPVFFAVCIVGWAELAIGILIGVVRDPVIWRTTDHRPAISEACGREATYLHQVHFPFRLVCQDCFQSILNCERAEVEQRAEEQK